MENLLTITVLSKACGILPQTVRMWEKRYNAFSPSRNENGLRLYTEEDMARAKLIVALIGSGHAISSIAHLSLDKLKALIPEAKDPKDLSDSSEVFKALGIKKIHHYLESFNIEMLGLEMQYLRMNTSVKDYIFNIILPVMREVGSLQAKGRYSVTQEHIVSTIVRDQLTKINLLNEGSFSSRVILATPEGNLHELGLQIADVICKANRVPTCYLGAAHPPECLSEAINALKGKVVVLSALSSDQWNYGKNIVSYLSEVDTLLDHKIKIIIGGGWEVEFPKFKNIKEVVFLKSFEELDSITSQLV